MKLLVIFAAAVLVLNCVVGQLFDDAVPSGSYNELIDDVLHADEYVPYYQQPSYRNYYQQPAQQQQQPHRYSAQPYYSQQYQQQQQQPAQPYYSQQYQQQQQQPAQPYYSQQYQQQQQQTAQPYYSQQYQPQQKQQQPLPDYSLTQLAHVSPSVDVSQGQGYDLYVAEFDAYNDDEADSIIQTLLHQLEQQENVRFTRSIKDQPLGQRIARGNL